jgi:hypothetical protein
VDELRASSVCARWSSGGSSARKGLWR